MIGGVMIIYNLELNDDEVFLLYQIMIRMIDIGSPPERMRAYLEIYDKIEKLFRKE